jgi:hypothetical protein
MQAAEYSKQIIIKTNMQEKRKMQQAQKHAYRNQDSSPKCNGAYKTDHNQNQTISL